MPVSGHILALLVSVDPRAYAGPEALGEPAPQDPPAPAEAAEPASAPAASPAARPAAPPSPRSRIPAEALRESRNIEVTTDLLGRSNRVDVQRHAGGRAVVDVARAREEGAGGVAEMMDKVPGVRAVEGGSGLGTSATKLNLAVRGADPRLSEQATVLLDEVPIAPAPYGAPSMALFPLSIFQIARVDTVRGGSSVRFGPWTSGGVFNMVSNPIPKNPTASIFAKSDHFGDAGVATAYGGTHRGVGIYVEYAPRFGRTYREHSEFVSHGGILKIEAPLGRRVSLQSSTHLFWERTNLPGGINTTAYAEDRFQSLRPYDFFDGHREATSAKLRVATRDEHELQLIAFYSHTLRRTAQATNLDFLNDNDPTFIFVQPRVFDVVGVEPRYAARVRHRGGAFHDLSFGTRGVFEAARLRGFQVDFPARPGDPLGDAGDSRVCPRGLDRPEGAPIALRCLNGRIGGYSFYAEDKLYLLDARLVITAGIRFELMKQSYYDIITSRAVPRPIYGGVLPGASIWYGTDTVAVYLGYGRSFGAPSYYSGTLSMPSDPLGRGRLLLRPELAETVEGGLKLMELGGVYAELSGWYRYFKTLRDEGDNSIDIIPAAHTYGGELDLSWEPGEVWEKAEGLELNAGYAYTGSRVLAGIYAGNRMPWYPAHEAWGAASYEAPIGLKFGTKVDYTSWQYTDYANWNMSRGTGEVGPMPPYTLMSAFATMRAALPLGWRIEVTAGVKNLLGQEWFTRSDDINGGMLAMRPRTFYVNLGLAHEWLRGKGGAQASRRRAGADRRRITAGERRRERWFWKTWGALL